MPDFAVGINELMEENERWEWQWERKREKRRKISKWWRGVVGGVKGEGMRAEGKGERKQKRGVGKGWVESRGR